MVLAVRGTKEFRERTYEFKNINGVNSNFEVPLTSDDLQVALCTDMEWEVELERMEHIAARGRDAAEHFKKILAERY